MTSSVFVRLGYLLPLTFLLQSIAADAQNVVFTANASASKIGLADQLQVTYTVQDAEDLKELNPGTFKDFKVLGGPFRQQNTNMQIMGNQVVQSSSRSFTFILQARHIGKITLPPATAVDGAGHTYRSNALVIDVVPGSVAGIQPRGQSTPGWEDDPFGGGDPFAALRQRQMAAMRQLIGAQARQPNIQQGIQQPAAASKADLGKDIFIRVDVDKKAVKIGEQVTAMYKLYARVPMQVAISKLPSLNGFWTQDFDIPKQQKPVEEIVNGKRYQVFTLKKSALFPQQPGNLVLDAAEAEGTARVSTQAQRGAQSEESFFQQIFGSGGSLMMSDPFFNDPFTEGSYEDVPLQLKSAPITIKVSEPPAAGKPEDYTGAVGSFSLAAKLDKTVLTTDEVATLTLTISGSGNLKLFDAPKLKLPNGLTSYEPNILDTITGRSTTISGEKIVTYSIAPRVAGDFAIPPLSLTWYDAQSGSYKTATTQSFTLKVKQGKMIASSSISNNKGTTSIRDDLNPSAALRPLIFSPLYWSMFALPLLLLVGVTVYRRREEEQRMDTAQQRNKLANKVAQKRLALAGTMLQSGDARGFYDEVSKSIWLYLSDKLGIPMSGLGKTTALQALAAHSVPTPVQQQIEKVLGECELALYASGSNGQQMQQTFSEAAGIITGLERTLRAS